MTEVQRESGDRPAGKAQAGSIRVDGLSRAYRIYALILVTAVFTVNFLDRIVIGLLLEPIKIDLKLSDTQLGLLTGISFALFYAVAGIPLARLADRGDRAKITALSIGFWGLVVMACLWVGNFYQMVLARVGAAVGESGCKPPTYSLVGDYFPEPTNRARALSIYFLASPLAGLSGFMLAGWLNELYGWRMTFFILGIPGLLLAILVKLTLIEPRNLRKAAPAAQVAKHSSLMDVSLLMWRQRTLRYLTISLILFYTVIFGVNPWYSVLAIRIDGMKTSELGIWLGSALGFGGMAGVLFGGFIGGRWLGHDERAQLRAIAAIVALATPVAGTYIFLPDRQAALFFLFPIFMIGSVFFAPTYALIQRLVADDMRATTAGIISLLTNLIGMGFGPLAVGALSDLLTPRFGVGSLRIAMITVACCALLASVTFLIASRTIREDLAAVPRN